MKLFFTRHGQSEANALRIISNRELPHALTELGRQQAWNLAERLNPIPFTRIYTSPILRAVQTAQILSDCLKTPFEVDDGLREFDCGIAEGRGDAAAWTLWSEVYTAWTEKGEYAARIEGGESWYDIHQRLAGLIERLVGQYRDTLANILLVSHGGILSAAFPALFTNYTAYKGRVFNHTVLITAEPGPDGLVWLSWEEA